MRLNVKVAVAAAAAFLLGACLAPAMASAAPVVQQQQVALEVGSDMGAGFTGVYGDMITLQPAVISDKAELPTDKFHFQAYVMDVETSGTGIPTGMVWKDFRDFEDIQLEDTNTVQPFSYQIGMDDAVILSDGSVVTPTFPYLIRCQYEPYGVSTVATDGVTAAPTYSETETVTLIKNASTRVSVSTHGTIKHAGTAFRFQVSPISGIGVIRVTISKSGSKTLTYNVTTDENGYASKTLKLGTKNGTYKVSARFLGNIYGAASKTVTKSVRASH
jgi:hypothetical protein